MTTTLFKNSKILGAVSVHPNEDASSGELFATVVWDGEPTEFRIFCDQMTDPSSNMRTAVSIAESRWEELSWSLPLSKLQLWCLSGIREHMPWFLTERLLEPDVDGNVFITSTPEEMVTVLVPNLIFRYDFKTDKTDLYGRLSCPPLDESNKINFDVNSWLGNHDYRFTVTDGNELTDFHAEG